MTDEQRPESVDPEEVAEVASRTEGWAAVLQLFQLATVGKTTQMTSMIFTILIGATLFSLVFRGLGGDDWHQSHLGVLLLH